MTKQSSKPQAPSATITITEGADGNIVINLHYVPHCNINDPHPVHKAACRMINVLYKDGAVKVVSAGVVAREDE
jgi:hypothetical protein